MITHTIEVNGKLVTYQVDPCGNLIPLDAPLAPPAEPETKTPPAPCVGCSGGV